ncbi:MAG: hypothetical protein Q4E74_05835 [Ruminococcus sp.]|nr:hypothetical protein [Ruminococcus sp.]
MTYNNEVMIITARFMSIKETSEKWNVPEIGVRILCEKNKIVGAYYRKGAWKIPVNAIKPVKSIKSMEQVPISFYTKSYPKGDNSNRWIVEKGDIYLDGTSVATDFYECDESERLYVEYQMSL